MFKKIFWGFFVFAVFVQVYAQDDFESLFSQGRSAYHQKDYKTAVDRYTKAFEKSGVKAVYTLVIGRR